MKKILFVMIMILLFPMFVYAEDNDLVLKSITLEKLSEDVEELSLATIENNKINLDLKMHEVGDFAEYIVTIENPTDKDLYLEQNIINTESTYFDYELLGVDKLTVIEKNSEKEFVLKVKYQNEVAKEKFFSAKFKDSASLSFLFSSGINPETKRNIILLLIAITTIFLFFKYQKKNKIILLLFVLGLIPIMTIAENNNDITIDYNITIKRVIPNPCTFDGELVQGAEYINGQYTYRYMQQGDVNGWSNIESDGWGVILTDKDSEEDVTTKLCTSINDKPIVSMQDIFSSSKTKDIDFSSFDTSKVINMAGMFYLASALEKVDLSSFDTSSVTTMGGMFYGATTLEKVDLHYFDTSNVTNMEGMFSGAVSLKTVDISSFDTSNVMNMSGMFRQTALEKLDLSHFNTSKVRYMGELASFLPSLEEVNLDGFDLTGSTSGSGIIGNMFLNTNNLKKVSMKNWKLPLTFTNALGCRTLQLCSENLEYIDVTGWDLSIAESLNGLFANSYTREIKGLETWDTSNVTDMSQMFYSLPNITTLDLSSFDTSNVINMNSMFQSANKLESLDLSSFDTSNVTNMNSMFNEATSLKTIKASNKFVTSQVTNSIGMFFGATSLVGENGTTYNLNYIDKTYARIDATGTPGYFTSIS